MKQNNTLPLKSSATFLKKELSTQIQFITSIVEELTITIQGLNSSYLNETTSSQIQLIRSNLISLENTVDNFNQFNKDSLTSQISKQTESINLQIKELKETIDNCIPLSEEKLAFKINSILLKIKSLESIITNQKQNDSFDQLIDYNARQINQFISFEKTTINLNLKKFSIVSFFIFIIISLYKLLNNEENNNFNLSSIQVSFKYSELDFINIHFISITLAAIFLNVFIAYILHNIIYLSTTDIYINHLGKKIIKDNPYKELNLVETGSSFFNKVLILPSPDLFFASHFKDKLKKDVEINELSNIPTYLDKEKLSISQWCSLKILLQNFIIKSNWSNLIFSIFLTITTALIINTFKDIRITEFLFILVFIRLISRGIEIAIAFYKDVVQTNAKIFIRGEIDEGGKSYSITDVKYLNGFKASLLREGTRLSLALHSLLELFITFALAFYLLFNILAGLSESYFDSPLNNPSIQIEFAEEQTNIKYLNGEKFEIIPPSFIECLLLSSSIGLFNISYSTYENIIISFLHFYQVLLSAILILLSIARYLNNDPSLSPQDERLYKIAALDKYMNITNKNSYLKEQLNYTKNPKK